MNNGVGLPDYTLLHISPFSVDNFKGSLYFTNLFFFGLWYGLIAQRHKTKRNDLNIYFFDFSNQQFTDTFMEENKTWSMDCDEFMEGPLGQYRSKNYEKYFKVMNFEEFYKWWKEIFFNAPQTKQLDNYFGY